MQNLEQKFRCPDLSAAESAARKLGAVDHGLLHQHDYFFPAPHARLKLRLINHQSAELIAYRRPDSATARTCDYLITPVANPDSLIATLTLALGQPKQLIKTRHLFIYQSTRIHLDQVDNLGHFVELEAVLTSISPAQGQAELQTIISALRLQDPVPTAYIDLLD